MSLTVADRARAIATFRYIEVRLMEITAGWTPTTPEMEVKVLFGRHIWDFAQNADLLGKRTFELRMPAQHSVAPIPSYVELLTTLAGEETTSGRLAALYDAFLPALQKRYQDYVCRTDALLDAPSVEACNRIIGNITRMRGEADALRKELSLTAVPVDKLIARESAHQSIVSTT